MVAQRGEALLHYRLIEKIGEGGMGEVWKAMDTTLDREVAVKILPDAFAKDPQRLARFKREAKVLASLNHPGIASIHGVHDSGETHFLVMELVSGEDLFKRLGRGPLSIDEATDFAVQIAEGLEAAHEIGVVHRDLKPANIRVTSKGRVKILDFGLAKALANHEQDPSAIQNAPTVGLTSEGVVLGTTAYMSPEQARGQDTDRRSDVWSFGCVLWECLTGERLFGGKTASDSIGAILHDEPDWSQLPSGVPENVRRVLRRCLVKGQDKRFHHIADARIELRETENATEGSASSAFPSGLARTLRRYRISTLLLSLALIITLATLLGRHYGLIGASGNAEIFENPLDKARFTRLTDFPGDETDAVISPDGRFVAFVSDRDGPFDLLVGQIESQEFRNITQRSTTDSWDVQAPFQKAGFTADGSEIWFGSNPGSGRRLQMTPLLGGPVRHFLGDGVGTVDWSRDGKRIVYQLIDPGDPVYVADHNGSNSTLILDSEEGYHQHNPIWSPNGTWIYLVRGRPNLENTDLWRMRPDGSGLERLTQDKRNVAYPTFLDERTLLYCAQELDGAGPWLWSLDVETGDSRRVSFGVDQYISISVSADGGRAVATVANPLASLWRVPILDRPATEGDVTPFPVPSLRAVAPRFGGEQLFYLSSRGSGDGLWKYHNGESAEIWRGSDTPLLEPPAIAPDGSTVGLVLRQNDQQLLHTLSADGAELRLLTDRVDARGGLSWSPDGGWLVVGGRIAGGNLGLFKVPVAGGPPEQIANGEASNPVWSPSGDLIVYTGVQVQAVSPLLGVRPDGSPVDLPEIDILRAGGLGSRVRFMPDGRGLVYMQGLSATQDFFLLDLETMESRRLTRLEDGATMRTFDITPDGTEIVFDRLRQGSDLVLIDLDRGGE